MSRRYRPIRWYHVSRNTTLLWFLLSGWRLGHSWFLEAFAARARSLAPSWGDRRVGERGVDGLLVEPADSPACWAEAFRKLCSNPGLLLRLKSGTRPPRHVKNVAFDFTLLYEKLLHRQSIAVSPRKGLQRDELLCGLLCLATNPASSSLRGGKENHRRASKYCPLG